MIVNGVTIDISGYPEEIMEQIESVIEEWQESENEDTDELFERISNTTDTYWS